MAEFETVGRLVEWRGPAPYWFLELPPDVAADVKDAARGLEYWGQVAVECLLAIGGGPFRTALFPRDGTYLLPLKVVVRRQAGLEPPIAGRELAVGFSLVRR